MSDERWILVSGDGWNACEASSRDDPIYGPELAKIGEAWLDAEGQRVVSITWCETHGKEARYNGEDCYPTLGECEIVEATLILPPKEQA